MCVCLRESLVILYVNNACDWSGELHEVPRESVTDVYVP